MARYSQSRPSVVYLLSWLPRVLNERPLIVLILLATISVGVSEAFRQTRHVPERNHGQAPHPSPPIPVPRYFNAWRERYLAANAAEDRTGLVRGIFLGEDSMISGETRSLFRSAGLSHLLAASGYNCWIVAAVFAIVMRLLLHLSAPLLPPKLALRLRIWVTPISRLCGAWLFWLWTDQSSPITRSVLMISMAFILDFLGYRAPFGRLLFVQYLVSLILLPRLWHSASFQLTFGCLFGILVFPRIIERLRPELSDWGNAVWSYFATSLGACLGTIPTTWIVFGEINFNSVMTNWFAVPPVSFIIMPLGLAQILLLAPHLPGGDSAALAWLVHILAKISALTTVFLKQWLIYWSRLVPPFRYLD